MKCEELHNQIPLFLYGELAFDDEEAVETHLEVCEPCRAAVARERSLHSMFDSGELMPPPTLLHESRGRLESALAADRRRSTWWRTLLDGLQIQLPKPAGALALLTLGFFAAHFAPLNNLPGLGTAGFLSQPTARVRYVEPGRDGHVQIVVDEVRQRVLSGSLEDSQIRNLLLAAMKDPTDPGLRVGSLELLKSQSGDEDVREAFIYALQFDANSGVRLKALEGLRGAVRQPEVRQAFAHALLADDVPGIRTQAIDLLVGNSQDPQLAGVLQETMRKEDNDYIRLRCKKALHAMKASVGTY